MTVSADNDTRTPPRQMALAHQRIGWWQLAAFLCLGMLLEAMHGFKIGSYLESPIRRHQWTLAHAHGTLLALLHLLFACGLLHNCFRRVSSVVVSSKLLTIASILLPFGFFLGGIGATEADPGIGIWLVPIGGITLLIAVVLLAINIGSLTEGDD